MINSLINYAMISWIREYLDPGKTILELGSGEGTKLLIENYKVISIEHDKTWLNIKDHSYIYAPLKEHKPIRNFNSENLWYDRDVLKKELNFKYDLLLIDGPPGPNRSGIIKYYDLFNNNIPWIFDDLQRRNEWKIIHSMSNKIKRPYIIYNAWGPDNPFGVL